MTRKIPQYMAVIISAAAVFSITACGFFDPFQIAGLKRYVYAVNSAGANMAVSTYSVSPNGALTRQGDSILARPYDPADLSAYRISATHNGSFLYSTNSYSNDIMAYAIGPHGVLSAVLGSPFPAGAGASTIAITHNDAFLYVANGGTDTISAYSVGSNGALTALPGSPFTTGAGPGGLVITPNDVYLYAGINGGGTAGSISVHLINMDGTLTSRGAIPTTISDATTLAMAPNGLYLYAIDVAGDQIMPYRIDATGSLSLNGSPVVLKLGIQWALSPLGGVVTPDSAYLYTYNNFDSSISILRIQGDGKLEELAASPFGYCRLPRDMAISQDGSCLYVTSKDDNKVYAYSVASNGSLTEITDSFLDTGAEPCGVTIVTRWTGE